MKLNPEKIRLMTSLAAFEKKEGAAGLKITQNYRFDYIFGQCFSAFLRFTFCFLLCVFLYILIGSNDLFYNIHLEGIREIMKKTTLCYLVGVFVYLLIALVLAEARYRKAVKATDRYAAGLKKLDRKFGKEKAGN